MISKLELYILDSSNNTTPFPSDAEQIVLYDFTREAQRMGGAPEIAATIQADGSLENLLTTKVFCEYDGERYFLKNTPSSSKDNTDPRYTFELTFVSERTILDNVYMIDAVQGNSGLDRYQSNSTNVVFMGDINEAVARLNAAMTYTGVGYSVVIDSGITTEDKQVSFENKYFTEVLQEYAQIYGVPYYFVGKVAHFGWSQYDVPTVKYLDGLISVSKDIQNTRIVNRATATGSSDNLPYYYPNPTPRGFITYSVPNGITVNSEHKLALLPVGSSLIYIPETQEIAVKGTYGFTKITDRQPNFSVSDEYATLIIPQYDDSEGQIVSGPVALLKNTFPESKDFTTTLVVRHPKGALTASADNMLPIYPLNAIACTRVDDALVEDASITVTVASSDTASSPSYANDEETTFRLDVDDFPSGEERYIFLRFVNPSSSRSDSKIFQFSFSVSERGLLQGWHIQDSNGITDEKVVNATDYGLRVSSSFVDGTVSYSVTRKIPFATTLMPPIYRESSGEKRFYNATNGAYSGVTFENEYSADNPKEGITKFEDIKPSIKGITNASGYRIDMFSAFEYDLNDNDNTVLVDGNTEEYQHPYFYAKLRKLDGVYGFNLFDQSLESGEMTVSMTSGVCGACKFTIMVDKNTQRNLVMVDDDGNLMRDASGNVMMATDARGLDNQNDTINNEVWVALKKDISTFGQIMPNVEYNHYPDTSDTFVLLHILMPEVYIKAAEERLKTAIIDFLVANNSVQFNSGINFSRIYLHNNPDVVAILTENSRISIDYNDKLYSYFISSVTYRKAKEDVLPEISVELSRDVQPTTSSVQSAISAINITQQQVTEIVDKSEKQPKYLKSDTADIAQGKITFKKGLDFADNLNTKDFKQGAIDGKGFGVYSDSQGRVIVEADKVISRQGGYGGSGSGINNYVTTDTEQDVTAHKNFEGGISMYGIPWEYDSEKDAWTIKGNVIITRGLAVYSTLKDEDIISVYDGIPIDNQTIQWKEVDGGKVLVVNPDMIGGSGNIDEDAVNELINAALEDYVPTTTTITAGTGLMGGGTLAANRTLSLATVGTAGTYAKVTTDAYGRVTSGTTLSASDIPSLPWSKITLGKPTTLAGYGITNAYTKTEVQDNFLALTGGQLSGNLEVYKSTAYIWANNNGANSIGLRAGYDVGLRHRSGSNVEQWALAVANSGNGMWTRFPLAVNMSVDEPRSAYSLYVNGDSYTTGTFYLNGAPLTYNSSKNAWQLEGNLIVTGGLATYTKLSGFTNLDVMGGVVTDGTTIHINSAGQLEVIGGTGGGGSVSITGAASTIVSSNLTASRALISNSSGKVAVSAVTSTELGYLDGVTSAIQTQLNNKQATLVSGTNIKTINGASILGSGNITISGGSSSSVAESLATPRSIWGKSFDGTADVDGTLTITTSYAALKFSGAGRYDATIGLDSTTVMGFSVANKSVFVNKHLYVGGQSSGASVAPLYVSGNAYVTGQVTQANSSDSRLKTNIRKFDVSEYLHSLGGAYAFEYIDSEQERDKYYKGTHIGFIYQNVKESMLQGMCVEREDGFGALNLLNSDYLALLGASAISHEDRIHSLEQQITELQAELNQLRKSA